MKNKKTLGVLLLLLTAMIWGMAFAAQRAGTGSVEPFTFVAARMAVSAAAIGPPAWFLLRKQSAAAGAAKEEKRAVRRSTLAGGICCGAFLGASSLFQQAGIMTTTAGKAGFITAMYILFVPLLERLLLRKRHGALVWTAVAVGVAGLYLLCVREGFAPARGDALVCACALVFSGHILCCGYFAGRCEPLALSAIQFAAAALFSAVLAFAFEQPSWTKISSALGPILYCGLVSGAVGYTLQMVAQRYTEPAVASLLMSLESVFAVLGGVLLLGEKMSGREMAGCVLMFAAILLVQIPAVGQKQTEKGKP